MLSNPLHRFSPYHALPSSGLLSNPQAHIQHASLEGLPQGPHYALQHLQQHVGAHNSHLQRSGPQGKHRQHPYRTGGGRSASVSGPVRRRISRACDQCNQLRTKCDGQHPCAHCIAEFGLGCEYQRERKKRGKASRKDLAQQAAARAAAAQGDRKSSSPGPETSKPNDRPEVKTASSAVANERRASETRGEDGLQDGERSSSMDSAPELATHATQMAGHPGILDGNELDEQATFDPNNYAGVHHAYDGQAMEAHMMNPGGHHVYGPNQSAMPTYPDLAYGMQPPPASGFTPSPSTFRMTTSPLSAYPIAGDGASPGWMNIPSPPRQYATHIPAPNFHNSQLRYPVLEPLVPHLGNILPLPLACDLIDVYFSSSSSAQMHPMSPYVLGCVFRKRSFLHPSRPRRCQPALLASMLWVAAQTSDASLLTSIPSARGKICQKLLELTVNLLRPLIHTPAEDASAISSPGAIDGVALGGLGVALPGTITLEALTSETGPFGAAGTVDDVVTYIHLATVVSASEYKGASLRWWNAAWSLARELRLGRELPRSMSAPDPESEGADGQPDIPGLVTEEEREERRRVWWLVYIVDRHLALCYNRPLFLLDIECDGLLQPLDDTAYQNAEFNPQAQMTDPNVMASDPSAQAQSRARGPTFECSGHSIYGYFLPLMAILGEIVDLNHARNHPRFGVGFRSAREFDEQAMEIRRHLEIYEKSLKKFAQRNLSANSNNNNRQTSEDQEDSSLNNEGHGPTDMGTPSVQSVHSVLTSVSRLSESEIQTRIVMAYGTHVMHVLHILLTGKWDPINLLDDIDLWISSQGFITATGHAVSAAEAIGHILEYDPGLEFMPFFFGIYLLQGSFLLLLIADKLQSEASPSVVKACETIIRAHEACVVTLNTEYQRNFSRVMRSALAQVRGRVPEDLGEQHQRRRELLALYRWTGDGTGLAL
ncbi:transcriptional activator xlnR [Cryphonectria parasitica EP155]|uniref:Transcriptional activator xlnR n=1 Tax=Cryphonectria parasitica (strain ATCC 38755 / EP155) TaxID=660469 RepID=A0A9P4Y661_CRYP1|nr:transcriptional activator xlnR [Cryphonectria parasitica EP155]KAF3767443.1 transcriptional activator xlnR [Cryphonectria parasitica EP155]